MEYSEIVRFHGHTCPGLAMGYRMSVAALEALAAERAEDEELVAVVENDGCGVDAVQCLTGCTFGKGNLIFKDYGKSVYTFFSRTTLRGVRVLLNTSAIPQALREDRAAYMDYLLSAPATEILTLTPVTNAAPPPARVRKTLSCARCGEGVMESRLQEVGGQLVCIPCAEARP